MSVSLFVFATVLSFLFAFATVFVCCHRKNQSEVSEGASRPGKVIDAEGTLPPSTALVCVSQLHISQSS